jgi:putative ABC transport system substrate-binding protein
VFLDLPEFSAKCLQLMRDTVPVLTKMGILWDPAVGSVQLQAVQAAAAALRITLEVVEVGRVAEFDAAFRTIVRSQAGAVLMLSSPLFSANPQLLATLCRQYRLPAINLFPDFAEKGGLMAYGPDLQALFRQAGGLTRKVLQGARPASLPIERPALFQFVVNLGTAKEIGLTIPDAILVRADQVID